MTSSATYSWNPTIEDLIVEAAERAGIDGSQLSDFQRGSARRSFNFLMIEWQNEGLKPWLVEKKTFTLTAGDDTPTVDPQMMDILDMVLRRSGVDTPMLPITRKDYLEIPDKTITGRPDRYWVNRQQDAAVLTIWPVPVNSTDIIVYNQLRRAQDIMESNATGANAETPDLHYLWLDAAAYGLGARIAEKYNPAREEKMHAKYGAAYKLASRETRERGPTTMTVSYGR